jgi:type 1 glutamine amidotransferase
MSTRLWAASLAVLLFAAGSIAEPVRVLFLSKSSGFEHSVIKQENGQPSYADKVLQGLAEKAGATITCTKDASLINAENLKNYDVVMFYTTGDLTEPGTDGTPPMAKTGPAELLAWVQGGGGFVGLHCATDTFHSTDGEPVNGYTEMVCANFLAHGRQFEGTLKHVDPKHPTLQGIEDGWTKLEEWYIFKNINTEKMHVLSLLDPSSEAKRDKRYDIPNYPVIWCREYGTGRVFYNAMGHREDVWDHPMFQQNIIDAIHWADGKGEAQAAPNYAETVPAPAAKP